MAKPIFIIDKLTGDYAFYATLPPILDAYPHLVKSTVEHYLTRNKLPYRDDKIEIYRGELKRSKRNREA